MATLIDELKAARHIRIHVNGIKFDATRATVEQCVAYATADISDTEVCRKHVTGWDGVTRDDLFADGVTDLVAYDKELFDIVIGDRPDWWTIIAKAVIAMSYARLQERDDRKKK